MKINDIILEKSFPDGDANDPGSVSGKDLTPYMNYVQDLASLGIEINQQAVSKGLALYSGGRLSPDEAYDSAKRRIDSMMRSGEYSSPENLARLKAEKDQFRSALSSMQSNMQQPGQGPTQQTMQFHNLSPGQQLQRGYNEISHGHLRKEYQNSDGVGLYDFILKMRQAMKVDTSGPIKLATSASKVGRNFITRLSGKTK